MQSMRTILIAVAVALVVATAVVHGMGIGRGPHHRGGMGGMGPHMGAPQSVGENPLPASAAVLERGAALFTAHCSACHGPQGRGDGPAAAGLNPLPPDLRRAAAMWSEGQVAARILAGGGAMPPFGKVLEDDAVWSIVHHVRGLR